MESRVSPLIHFTLPPIKMNMFLLHSVNFPLEVYLCLLVFAGVIVRFACSVLLNAGRLGALAT
jgi:hypothetical protein